MKHILYIALVAFIGFSCEKEVDLNIPDIESSLVVECYLEPGKPYQLTLSETVNFTDDLTLNDVKNALVLISYKGKIDTLQNLLFADTINDKVYNYSSTTSAPPYDSIDFNENFSLYIKGPKGRVITGTARFLPKVPLDTVKIIPNKDNSIAYLLASYQEIVGQKNFYRISFIRGELDGEIIQDFVLDDGLFTDEVITFGTGYDFFNDDSAYVTLYHLTEQDFEFMESAQLAVESNGNPFATPTKLISTVDGGLGIFSALSYDRQNFKISF